jgi:hypothetical protein
VPGLHRQRHTVLRREPPRHGPDPAQPDADRRQHGRERFIGRLVPGSNRFNGAYQAGQGIDDTMQSGNAFKISPRFGFTYDVSGTQSTIVRGGFGIFYDRPQGNQVFDMIANAPGVLVSRLQWGRLQDMSSGGTGTDPFPTLSLNPSGFDFKPPKSTQWNVGVQRKLFSRMIFDIAYVGGKWTDELRQSQINAVPRGAKFLPQNQDPTRAPSATPGATALPDDLLRPYPGYGGIRMWDYSGYHNYHSLQTGLQRRFDKGFMFSAFWVWSKTLTINNDDFSAGLPNSTKEEIKRLDYSYAAQDRPHNVVLNAIWQTPKVADGVLGAIANNLAALRACTVGPAAGRTAVGYSIPGIGAANLVGNDGNPGARIVKTCDPGGARAAIRNAVQHQLLRPAAAGQRRLRVGALLHVAAADQQPRHVGLEVVPAGKRARFEVRLDAFNALNHTQFTGVNATANFASLTDRTITNLPFDANGNLIRNNGFGSVNGVASPRRLQLVNAADVLDTYLVAFGGRRHVLAPAPVFVWC